MRTNCASHILGIIATLLVLASAVSDPGLAQSGSSDDEQAIWNLEHAYWHYAQENDLTRYLTLWHEDVLAWPAPYMTPAHKEHIADWITSAASNGLTGKVVEFKPAGIQITDNVAVTCYWITGEWFDKNGKSTSKDTSRIMHTWLKNGGEWQIISGMSMPELTTEQK